MTNLARVCSYILVAVLIASPAAVGVAEEGELLSWEELPAIPDELGCCRPVCRRHNDALIVAGGANFPQPVWETDKVWHDRIYVLREEAETSVAGRRQAAATDRLRRGGLDGMTESSAWAAMMRRDFRRCVPAAMGRRRTDHGDGLSAAAQAVCLRSGRADRQSDLSGRRTNGPASNGDGEFLVA